jgi:hypothetical protein
LPTLGGIDPPAPAGVQRGPPKSVGRLAINRPTNCASVSWQRGAAAGNLCLTASNRRASQGETSRRHCWRHDWVNSRSLSIRSNNRRGELIV